jgi:hypothetical protein
MKAGTGSRLFANEGIANQLQIAGSWSIMGIIFNTALRVRAMASRELRRTALCLFLFGTLLCAAAMPAQSSAPGRGVSGEVQQTGKILSVRKIPVGYHFVTRYPQVRYYLLYLTVRVSDKTYCSEYETPVIQEMDDLFAAQDKDVNVVLNGKKLTVRTPSGRILKAFLSEHNQC